MKANTLKYLFAVGIVSLLAACGSSPKAMYYHGSFHDNVYEHLKNDDTSIGKQIEKMEKYFQEAEHKKQAVAPGTHAHLGMLLIHSGQQQAAFREFEAEKKLFPESAAFMDFLMKKSNLQSVAKGEKK